MKTIKRHKAPVFMVCLSLFVAILLTIFPVSEVLLTYKLVNGVKTVEFVSKFEGIYKIFVSTILATGLWIPVRIWNDKKRRENPGFVSYELRRFAINAYFGILSLLPSAMGIASIIIWILQADL